MPRRKNHLLDAIESIAKAQAELTERVDKHSKIIESQGQDIAALEKKVMDLRNCAIRAEIANDVPTKEVADRYGLTSARVSQIAPRKLN